jgi:hypothetical protein
MRGACAARRAIHATRLLAIRYGITRKIAVMFGGLVERLNF